jgi:hypothetical protein
MQRSVERLSAPIEIATAINIHALRRCVMLIILMDKQAAMNCRKVDNAIINIIFTSANLNDQSRES